MRKSKKGIPIDELFKQLFCYFLDGTSLRLIRFDEIKEDEGYAETIESKRERMLSSHSAKRFFKSFSPVRIWLFRKLLQDLFIWRLNIEKPSVIILDIDTTVMNNDDAIRREGVKYTYKRIKGYFWTKLETNDKFVFFLLGIVVCTVGLVIGIIGSSVQLSKASN